MLVPVLYIYKLWLVVTNCLHGHCRSKTFDAAADGYGRGEGCVVFVLRRSADRGASSEPLAVMHGTPLSASCNKTAQPHTAGPPQLLAMVSVAVLSGWFFSAE